MMIKQVLWDWNGTLLDDVQYAMDVRNRCFPAFGLPGIHDVDAYRRQFTFPVRIYYQRAGVTDENFDQVAHAWMDEYMRGLDQAPLHPDAVETLERFERAGLRQVVLSATKRDMLEEHIGLFPIRHFFAEVLGLGDIYAVSKEQVGRDYLQHCGILPSETVMLGDTLHDAEVARAIGANCILIARGHQSRATLETSGFPVVDSLTQAADNVLNQK
ncbi:MAG: HAD hydrolase-like protein [Clostridiales bacterium]|nr:HAD hydrolase-like protein [Clostridiales bacterium]